DALDKTARAASSQSLAHNTVSSGSLGHLARRIHSQKITCRDGIAGHGLPDALNLHGHTVADVDDVRRLKDQEAQSCLAGSRAQDNVATRIKFDSLACAALDFCASHRREGGAGRSRSTDVHDVTSCLCYFTRPVKGSSAGFIS